MRAMAAETKQLSLDADQERWFAGSCGKLDPERLRRLLMTIVNIPSPTGAERAIAEFVGRTMRENLPEARVSYQPVNEQTGNTIAELRGKGGGATLMLYAPLDTHLEGDPEKDLPWAGPVLRRDMIARASADGDLVYGLGAANPKSMVATLIEIASALSAAKVPMIGDLIVAFAGGGMPVQVAQRDQCGMSSGLYHLLSHGVAPDFAIIMKPIWRVFAEEPGMCWFKVMVKGTLGYAGIPRNAPGYQSSILPAASVIQELESWIPKYTERNSSATIAAEGHIASVRAGWPERPAFPSATTEIYLDLRCNPRTTPAEVRAQFAEAIVQIARNHPEVNIDWQMYGAVPGGATDPNNWIVQSCRRGWERVEGHPHGDPPRLGGQTDGALIRRLGIPCARIGFPAPPRSAPAEFRQGLGGMGVVAIGDLIKTARAIVYAAIDTLTRPRQSLG
jgi:acetylornithine deacetylase/succinyl-diaminopimelate desuccinylase-like protein